MTRLYWSKEEDDALKLMWNKPHITFDDMLRVLKGRTLDSIRNRASRIGLPPKNRDMKNEIDNEYLKKLLRVVDG